MSRQLIESVKRHEGWRDTAYLDSEGVLTIGYGTNLEELVIDHSTGEAWMLRKLEISRREAQKFPEYQEFDTADRQDVFIEMIYNMGAPRVAGFKRMLAAIRERNWELAAEEMLDSKWRKQVKIRAYRLAAVMEHGCWAAADSVIYTR